MSTHHNIIVAGQVEEHAGDRFDCLRCYRSKKTPLVQRDGPTLPPNLNAAETKAAPNPGVSAMALESPSPTGTPILPVKLVPILVLVGAVAGAVLVFAPEHTIAHKVAASVLGFLTLIGVASPGLRKV